MTSTIQQFIADSPILAVFVVFWAGALASLSSCCIVRVPMVLSYLAGGADSKKRALIVTLFFVVGMTVTYTFLGLFLAVFGDLVFTSVKANKYVFWSLGVALFICGMYIAGLIHIRLIPKSFQLHERFKHVTFIGALFFGVFFALIEMPTCPCCGGVLLALAGIVVTQKLSVYAVLIFASFAIGQSFPVMAVAVAMSLVKKDIIMWLTPKVHRLEERVRLLAGNILMVLGVYLFIIA